MSIDPNLPFIYKGYGFYLLLSKPIIFSTRRVCKKYTTYYKILDKVTRRMISQWNFFIKNSWYGYWYMSFHLSDARQIISFIPTLARDQFSTIIKRSWKSSLNGAEKAQKYRTDILSSIKVSVCHRDRKSKSQWQKMRFWWNVFMAYK